ncbi:LuxR C-terminal-related transcriptional regulator [Bradyrhizobium sp. HKCCYLS20291]|uniref:LuxR C-terminal-related transcriptional regulator n=1 Tax=Bradyrhizobium sp. HKCCYLS20291 TaxID=3420766 RepID=UPI003EBF1BF8
MKNSKMSWVCDMPRRFVATVLIGPNALRREGTLLVLGDTEFRVVALASDLGKIVSASLAQYGELLFVVDCGSDISSIVDKVAAIKSDLPGSRFVLLAEYSSSELVLAAFRAGVNAYLVNVPTRDVFIKALELVMLGEPILPVELLNDLEVWSEAFSKTLGTATSDVSEADRPVDPFIEGPRSPLSEQEKAILRCIAHGASNKQIARKLGIAEATVKVHVKSILRKVDVQNRTQAAIWAMSRIGYRAPFASDEVPIALEAPMADVACDHAHRNGEAVLQVDDREIMLVRPK